jgi:hypothetical protein
MAESITPSEATNPVVFFDIALAGKGGAVNSNPKAGFQFPIA